MLMVSGRSDEFLMVRRSVAKRLAKEHTYFGYLSPNRVTIPVFMRHYRQTEEISHAGGI